MEGVTNPDALRNRLFFRLGEFIYDYRRMMVAIGIILCMGLGSLFFMGPDWSEAYGEGDLESLQATALYREEFLNEYEDVRRFVFLVHHEQLNDSSNEWRDAVIAALSDVEKHPQMDIIYSWEVSAEERHTIVLEDEDGFWAMNEILISGSRKESKEYYADVHDSIEIDGDFTSWRTGDIAIGHQFDTRITNDLIKAELVSGPLALLILLVVFGTLIAALMPIGMGVMTVVAAMGVTVWLSNITDVTQYAINIISLIGIGVSIDYSLFIVKRFREELGRGHDVRTATAMSVATAGKAVFFSGITVAVGLMGMLFFENTGLPSLGFGGTLAVSLAMIYSIIVLPAVLAVLGQRINKGEILKRFQKESEEGFWGRTAYVVMERPWTVLIPTLILLIGAGLPFLQAELSLSSTQALPPEDESRLGSEKIDELWPESAQNLAIIVVDLDGTSPLDENNLRALHAWMVGQLADSNVVNVYGAALPQVGMSADEVIMYWQAPDEAFSEDNRSIRNYLRNKFVSEDVTFVSISMAGEETSTESRKHVEQIRSEMLDLIEGLDSGDDAIILVGGFAAYNADTLDVIKDNLPIALAFIIFTTIVLIYVQVGSIVIPFKAIVMNTLSITASFGMLVVVFQWGWGSELLGFTPQPIDSMNPIIMFCIVFGLSMDYEILMLSRIHEEWERTGDNTKAVAMGLQKTGRLITGAAAIMIVVFLSFGLSSVLLVKQIGLGLALAIFIDATIVRALVVPATMRLMGKWNWWNPSWLPTIHRSIIEDE